MPAVPVFQLPYVNVNEATHPLPSLAVCIAAKLNNVQLMLLAVEGVAVCCACVIWLIVLLQRVAVQRYSMFSVFMVGL
jgi:hypothetical protein